MENALQDIPVEQEEIRSETFLTSSTNARVQALRAVSQRLDDPDQNFFGFKAASPAALSGELLPLLLATYPRYQDRLSRRLVQLCFRSALRNPSLEAAAARSICQFLQDEARKPVVAPANAFVLLEWCVVIHRELAETKAVFLWEYFPSVSAAAALFLEKCLDTTSARSGLRSSALVIARRGLHMVLRPDDLGSRALSALKAALVTSPLATRDNAPYLGLVAGVSSRIPAREPQFRSVVDDILAFYVKFVIGSRTVVPSHIASGLRDFFRTFVSIDTFSRDILPALEKAILRSPEVVLRNVIPSLIDCLPANIDLSDPLAASLLQPLLSSFKSTNAIIREGSLQALESILTKSHQPKPISNFVGVLLNQLKSSKIVEQRVLLARTILAVPPSLEISKVVNESLAGLAAKETNEVVLDFLVAALCAHLKPVITGDQHVEKGVFDTLLKGCAEKRPAFRKIWILKLADIFWQINKPVENNDTIQFVASALAKMMDAFNETAANPILAAQSGVVATGYVTVALAGSTFLAVQPFPSINHNMTLQHALIASPKPSFLLNTKVYARLTAVEDMLWATRALISTASSLAHANEESKISWAQAILYLLTSADVGFAIRRDAGKALSEAHLKNPKTIGESMVLGIWQWIQALAANEKESAAVASKTGRTRLRSAFKQISLPKAAWQKRHLKIPAEVLKARAVSTVVLCRPQLIPGMDWIKDCLQNGVDPGALVHETSGQLLTEILERFQQGEMQNSDEIRAAACSAAADLAFVAPEVAVPLLMDRIRSDLDSEPLGNLDPNAAAIFRTPEGVSFVDVLNSKAINVIENKNVKDYDVLKWEEEIRNKLAQKKGLPKKLTADQQAKLDAQLAREAEIRKQVGQIVTRLRRGAGFLKALAYGPPTDARLWMIEGVGFLLDALKAGGALLVENELIGAYLALADRLAPRLGTVRPFIGVAALRASGLGPLSEDLRQEPLGELVTRVLYRLRFAAEQRPFDAVSLGYMLPLITIVLGEGGVGYPSGEDADAQVLLALEFLSVQMDSCSDPFLPRTLIIQCLIEAMQRYTPHFRLLKDALIVLCKSIAANVRQEELNILLQSLTLPQPSVRNSVLHAINSNISLTHLRRPKEIWLACDDEDEENAELALTIWEHQGLEVEEELVFDMLEYLRSPHRSIRLAAAHSLSQTIDEYRPTLPKVLDMLKETYREAAKPLVPKRDKFGMVQKGDISDPWQSRSGIALAFKSLVPVFETTAFVPLMNFLISEGPLADRNSTVRSEMVDAGTHLVASRGQETLEPLMSLFETVLEAPDEGTQESDWVNEAVIVLYGSVSRHLGAGEARVNVVMSKLLDTLSTPSEPVQYAVAGCLPSLVRLVDTGNVASHVERLLKELFESKQYATRRGAAYGLAGIVSGKGLAAFRQFRIMLALRAAAENKKSANHRQGALFAYELFSLILGRIFEPYMIEILPQLLACFGDADASVREAGLDTAKTCFASLSSFGVRQVLPRLLEGLNETQWRSKKGACDLLGAMAYLDPQQLANSLPDIIPPLTAVLNDSHKEVRASANRSLQRFGEVINNPEVKGLVDILLKALSDPIKHTEEALDALIKVSFVHYLDAPSLALVVRILERGLGDRSSTKRKSAQIIGSLAHLTERKDLISHLPILVSGLRLATVDPVPATRATASKALGGLIEKLGEDALPDLIPSLMASLKSDTGAGDRLGSAQALSEVLAGLGTTRLEETLPTILQNVSSTKPTVREGFMTLFVFLPACFGGSFAAYLSQIIPSILGGLADEIEAIRDIALRAGRLLVKNFATKAIDLLLPELQHGLADNSHRIRLSSVELVGDLLFNITGISKTDVEEEEDDSATHAGQSLLEVLGEERRNRVLASLYICRCDTSGLVRSAAIAVWKSLVSTPRTLRELVPTLTQMIVTRLSSSNMEHKVIVGNALGEVIRKAGEGVLASLLPLLEDGLQTSTDADNRQGICIALREVVTSASPEAVEEYEKKLIGIVRIALVDSDEDVRDAAAESFDSLQQVFGKRAVDQVLPHLLSLLRDEAEAENALSALLTLLTDTTRANVILPNLIPTLIASPITAFNARALASLAKVGGAAIRSRLPVIFAALAKDIVENPGGETHKELSSAFDAILQSVDEFDGLNNAMSVMLGLVKNDDHRRRALAAHHLANFFSAGTVDYSRYKQDLIRVLLISFDDRDQAVVEAAWGALSNLVSRLRKEEMENLVISTRQVLQQVGVSGSNLPGFALPKGILPILQIFLQGLMNGTAEQRMQAAMGISDIIDRTGPDSLKPFVTQITGPLIRVVSERSADVKCAVLHTLNQLLDKIPTFLRPFLPQLQRTFTKSIADPSSDLLRSRATKALSTLITLTPRVDPLIAELVAGAKTPETGVRNAMLQGLREVVGKVGSNMSDASRDSILALIDTFRSSDDEQMAVTNAKLLGAMIKVLPPNKAQPLIRNRVLTPARTEASVLALNAVLIESPLTLINDYASETRNVICEGMEGRSLLVQRNCVLAAGKWLLALSKTDTPEDSELNEEIVTALADAVRADDIDTRRLALVVIRTVARRNRILIAPFLAKLTPPIFACVRDPVIPVKLAAEAAFLELFDVVEQDAEAWDEYAKSDDFRGLGVGVQRSMGDYFKRVVVRLAGQAKESREAGGIVLGLRRDEIEDEREVNMVGRVVVEGDLGLT